MPQIQLGTPKYSSVSSPPGLEHVATRGGGDEQHHAEHDADGAAESAQVFPLQGLRRDPHRPAMRVLGIVGVAVEHRHRDLGELYRHAEETDYPHPEHGAGTAKRDRERNAADIAEADGRRQGCRQRLEVIDGAGIVRVVVDTADDREQHVLVPQIAVEQGQKGAEVAH
jgi:hypothetical protein